MVAGSTSASSTDVHAEWQSWRWRALRHKRCLSWSMALAVEDTRLSLGGVEWWAWPLPSWRTSPTETCPPRHNDTNMKLPMPRPNVTTKTRSTQRRLPQPEQCGSGHSVSHRTSWRVPNSNMAGERISGTPIPLAIQQVLRAKQNDSAIRHKRWHGIGAALALIDTVRFVGDNYGFVHSLPGGQIRLLPPSCCGIHYWLMTQAITKLRSRPSQAT